MDALIPELLKDEDGIPTIPAPPVDEDSCSLLGQTALVVQGLMAILVLSSLIIKRYRESPRRPWPVWMGDVSKQVIGQGFLHSSNILFSTLLSNVGSKNACTAYFLSILIDCTLGVLVIYSVLRIFSHILTDKLHLPGFKNGQYYNLPSPSQSNGVDLPDNSLDGGEAPILKPKFQITWWGRQLLIYIATLVVMKLAILGFFWIPAVFSLGDWLLSWLGQNAKIVFVLMIFPLAMNAFQFLLIDAILKSNAAHPAPLNKEETDYDQANPSSSSRRRDNDDSRDGDDDDENQAFLASNERDVEDSVLHGAGQGEEDARSIRVGSTLPSYQSSGNPTHQHQQSQQRIHTPQPIQRTTDVPTSPVYPPSFSSTSSHTLLEAKTPITHHYQISEKALRPSGTLAVESQQPQRTLSAQSRVSQESEKSGDGWDWLDEDEVVEQKREAPGMQRSDSRRIAAVV